MSLSNISAQIAAARADLDQLVESHRSMFAGLTNGYGEGRDDLVAAMIGTMLATSSLEEFGHMAAIAVLAVDRLAHQPRPELPEIELGDH